MRTPDDAGAQVSAPGEPQAQRRQEPIPIQVLEIDLLRADQVVKAVLQILAQEAASNVRDPGLRPPFPERPQLDDPADECVGLVEAEVPLAVREGALPQNERVRAALQLEPQAEGGDEP